jgi:hypothetical protein
MRRIGRKPRLLLFFAGFLTAGLGFLTPRARADALSDATACFDRRSALEEGRNELIRQADSLGRVIDATRQEGKKVPEVWLRQAEQINRRAVDRELDLMALRERCRPLAEAALQVCAARIARLQSELESGRGSAESSVELVRLRTLRAQLESGLAGPAVVGYPMLAVDSTDTQGTLAAKLQYYVDVRGYLETLDQRLVSRGTQVTEERRSLLEARRFLQDLALVDEGGRASTGGSIQLRRGIGGGGDVPDDAVDRVTGGATRLPDRSGDLEFVLGLAPATPEESDRIIRLLEGYRLEIKRELEAVTKESDRIRGQILPAVPAAR